MISSQKAFFCMDFFLEYNYMAIAWQRNLATTPAILENYNNNSNKAIPSVEKRWVYLINFIVDKRIFLLELFIDGSPYRYICN